MFGNAVERTPYAAVSYGIKHDLHCSIRFGIRFNVHEQYTFNVNASIYFATGIHMYKGREGRPLSVRKCVITKGEERNVTWSQIGSYSGRTPVVCEQYRSPFWVWQCVNWGSCEQSKLISRSGCSWFQGKGHAQSAAEQPLIGGPSTFYTRADIQQLTHTGAVEVYISKFIIMALDKAQ
jgi:hypothetical protein